MNKYEVFKFLSRFFDINALYRNLKFARDFESEVYWLFVLLKKNFMLLTELFIFRFSFEKSLINLRAQEISFDH
jgi:hypothetical protein